MAHSGKRIAIIGAGSHAKDQHYPALRYTDEIDLCAACDLDEAKLDHVRTEYSIPAVYTDYRRMIEQEAPDGVVVVMRPMDMTDVVLGCLDMGVHLMIEKPPGCTLADAERIAERAAARGCRVMVSLNRRFMPLVRKLREDARERGVVYCSATYNKDGFTGSKWQWPSSLPLADSIHLIDLMRFVAGDVAEVFAHAAARDAEFTNAHSAALVFECGASGTVNTHHCVGARVHRFEVHAQGLSAYLDVGDPHQPSCELFLDGKPADPPPHEDLGLPPDLGVENYYETLHFARYAAGEEPPECELAEVIETVRLCEAIASGFRGCMSEFAPSL